MQSTTTAKKNPRWVTIGTATRQHSALQLEVLIGPAKGVYFVAAADVSRMTEESVQVYKLRTVQGERIPEVVGFTYSTTNGNMITVQLDAPAARFMIPALALLSHLARPAANKPTRITAPREEVEVGSSPLQAVPA